MPAHNKRSDSPQDFSPSIIWLPGQAPTRPLPPKRILPVRAGKDKPNIGWPRTPNSPANIARWTGRSAAVRLKGSDLFVIDLDVHVEAVRDAIVAELTARWPRFMAACLRRHSQAIKLALIGRASTVKRSLATRWFAGEGAGPHGDRVEFLTGNNVKYLGVWGVHSPGREYGYHGRSILEVPVNALPWFPDGDIYTACDACEAIMQAHGLAPVTPPGSTKSATQVYDLEPEMIFPCSCGDQVTLADLEDHVVADAYLAGKGRGSGTPGRGYATLWDPHSTTPDRVSVLTSTSTGLCLHDFKTNITHRWKDRAPPEDFTDLMAELMAMHDKRQAGERS
jgi:hypothetical protein